MARDPAEALALWRYHLIAEALNPKLPGRERGLLVRRIATDEYVTPGGDPRQVSRNTLDRWIRRYRAEGLAGLRDRPRSDHGSARLDPALLDEAIRLSSGARRPRDSRSRPWPASRSRKGPTSTSPIQRSFGASASYRPNVRPSRSSSPRVKPRRRNCSARVRSAMRTPWRARTISLMWAALRAGTSRRSTGMGHRHLSWGGVNAFQASVTGPGRLMPALLETSRGGGHYPP